MMDGNSDFMKDLVAAKQETLRNSGKPAHGEPGPNALRKASGNLLIRLGERLAGGQPAVPRQPRPQGRLAMP